MSLRGRLVVGLLALAAVGLSVAGAATYGTLRLFLLDRVDQQLDAARLPARNALAADQADAAQAGRTARRALPSGTYAEWRRANGSTRAAASFSLEADSTSGPRLPDLLPGSGGAGTRERFTADADEGGGDYRVLAEELPRGGTIVVALPLADVHDTLRRLLVAEFAVGGFVLAAVAALGWWLAGRSLRPLGAIAATADAFGRGDFATGEARAGALDRRVDVDDPASEVGRVGTAFNAMLTRIEQELAERRRSEERLREFVADASHELRTPLTSIRGYAELFRRGADHRPADLAMAMRRIEEESERMSALVEDLLLLARLDEGPALVRVPVDLSVLAADAVADARVAQPERPIALVADGPAMVIGDEDRLRQVVANLVTNGLVHTPVDTALAVQVAAANGEVVLEVADQGPGLDADAASRVFERFHRTDAGRARSSGGTGLGLAIVAAVVQAHGGTVELDTAPGGGATFRVRLPGQFTLGSSG